MSARSEKMTYIAVTDTVESLRPTCFKAMLSQVVFYIKCTG